MTITLDVLVVSYNTSKLLRPMFNAMDQAAAAVKIQLRYLVLDNESSDDSVCELSKFPLAKLIVNDVNVGFGRANNQLLPLVEADYVLLLNTDAFVSPDTLNLTLSFMANNPDCGILGVKLVGRDGELQPSCRYFPTPWNLFLARTGLARIFKKSVMVDDMIWAHDDVRECDWVPGCYYLVRRTVLDQIGLFDPRFFMYYEEVDHCRRAKAAGWKIFFYPHTSVVHLGGESAKTTGEISEGGKQLSALQIESEHLYMRKHYGLIGLLNHCILYYIGVFLAFLKAVLQRKNSGFLERLSANAKMFFKILMVTGFGKHSAK